MTRTPISGHCLCGAVRYTAAGPVLATAICHCDDCQRASGSAFAVVIGVRAATLQLEGELATFETVGTDSGERRQRRFCSRCGSQVLSVMAEAPDLALLKAGTLDDRSWLSPTVEVWRQSAQPWTQRQRRRPGLRRGAPTIVLRAVEAVLRRARKTAARDGVTPSPPNDAPAARAGDSL
jgi:hypothetical protein